MMTEANNIAPASTPVETKEMCRLHTSEFEDAVKDYPLYSQDGKGKEAICVAVFAIGNIRWYVLEGEIDGGDITMFGIVVGLYEDEYGYFSLKELSEVCVGSPIGIIHVERMENFKPTPLKNIQDSRIQKYLSRFE